MGMMPGSDMGRFAAMLGYEGPRDGVRSVAVRFLWDDLAVVEVWDVEGVGRRFPVEKSKLKAAVESL